jgi:hypothetical protein
MSTLLEDEKAIRGLLAAYCFCVDRSDADAFVELFTEDGVWDRGPWGRLEGRRALHDYVRAAAGAETPRKIKVRHFCANEVISIAGDTATARCYVLAMNAAPTPSVPLVIGHYQDELVKAGDRWRIKSRCLRNE